MELKPNNDPHAGSFGFGLTILEVTRFQNIMRREYGEVLTPEAAWGRAIEVLALFRMLVGTLPEDSSAPSSNIGAIDRGPRSGQR